MVAMRIVPAHVAHVVGDAQTCGSQQHFDGDPEAVTCDLAVTHRKGSRKSDHRNAAGNRIWSLATRKGQPAYGRVKPGTEGNPRLFGQCADGNHEGCLWRLGDIECSCPCGHTAQRERELGTAVAW